MTTADKVSMGMENGLRVQTDNKKTDNRTMNRKNNNGSGSEVTWYNQQRYLMHDGRPSTEKVQWLQYEV
jgi:hypothetical protein